MKSLFAFIKKEWMEQVRSARLWITIALFVVLGIMNPAIAKITPWMFNALREAFEESGMVIPEEITVSAMDSWVQFFKNIPVGMITFVLVQGLIFTKEYGSSTLILSLTKGLERRKVVIAKTSVLLAIWTAAYWLCFGITYLGNMCFWDNSVAQNLMLSVICWWLYGVFIVSLITLFSTLFNSYMGVLLGIGASVLGMSIVGFIPKVDKFMPTFLTDGNSLIYGMVEAKTYLASIIITVVVLIGCFVASIPIFNKKQL